MRPPAAAGTFYSASVSGLKRQLEESFSASKVGELPVIGAVVPHAGYMYSGAVAAKVYSCLPRRETFILIGPNHHGLGLPVAMSRETWATPLGEVEVDQEMAQALEGSIIGTDELAHIHEHSLEVQLPFLQYRFTGFKILPISMGFQDQETAEEVGEAVDQAIRSLGRSCTVIASSDLTHYESQGSARKKDISLIEAVLQMDVPRIFHTVHSLDLSSCGYGPIAAMVTAARGLGATTGKLLTYATSGDVTGDYSQVVGYSGIIFT